MKYIDEFRDRRLIDRVARRIRDSAGPGRTYRIMEVCGTHTTAIFRWGLRDLLPANIRLISGPGCPVCVTPNVYIDKAIALAKCSDIIIATFGDMMKVPGSFSSLEKVKASGAKVVIVYSSMDALTLAKHSPDKEVVFLGVGFETTIPTVAESIIEAKSRGVKNYSVLCGHKTMPKILRALLESGDVPIDGFLLPGHVSAVIGKKPYEFLAKRYNKRCVISGFEPLDILESILMILRQKAPEVEIEYSRIVSKSGNRLAKKCIEKVFEAAPSDWRGIGRVGGSGLEIRKAFSDFDAERKFRPKAGRPRKKSMCICGDVIKGLKTPLKCKLFAKACNPEDPVGACMVSSEGTCAAYYRYRRV